MSSLKTTVSIEGELVDLAEVFKALAAAAAATPRPEPIVHSHVPFNVGAPASGIAGSTVMYDPDKHTLGGQPVDVSPSQMVQNLNTDLTEGSADEPETQEQSGKRRRRTKAEIVADRLAQEAATQGLAEVEKLDEAVNAFEAGITAATQSEEPEMEHASTILSRAIESNLNHTGPAPETTPIPNATEPATSVEVSGAVVHTVTVADKPTTAQPNTTSATVDGTSPFIAELRAFCQQKMLGKPENQVLIKNLLTEFGAAGLSALKEVDKMAFKQRLEALPFK